MKNISVKWQMIFICVLFTSVPLIILGILSYQLAKDETFKQIEVRLRQQALQVKLLVEETYERIKEQLAQQKQRAQLLAKAEIHHIRKLIANAPDMEQLKQALASYRIGKSGYVWIIDVKARYILSPNRSLDDQSMLNFQDATGRYIFREAIQAAQLMTPDEIHFMTYSLNTQDSTQQFLNAIFPCIYSGQDWIVGVTLALDEFIQSDIESQLKEAVKDKIASMVVGKTGYIYILNDKGDYVLSHQRKRDGENILHVTDTNGKAYVRDIVETGTRLQGNDSGLLYYRWQNKEDPHPRTKLSAFVYFPQWKWIIGPSAYQDDFLDGLEQIRILTIRIVIISIVICSIITFLFAHVMTREFRSIASNMKRISKGNLDVRISGQPGKNEIGQMKLAMEQMATNLNNTVQMARRISEGDLNVQVRILSSEDMFGKALDNMVNQLKRVVNDVVSSCQINKKMAHRLQASAQDAMLQSQQISQTSEIIAQGNSEQASSSDEISSSMEQMNANIKQTADNSHETEKIANQSLINIRQCAETVNQNLEAMHTIMEKIAVIEEIANQTNMLALNASIEAARAQKFGKGFSVVATEVMKLSKRSRKAAEEISYLTTSCLRISEKAGKLLEKTVPDIQKTAELIQEVSAASKEQSVGIEQISQAIHQLDMVIQKNASAAEEMSASASTLLDNSDELASNSVEMAAQSDALFNTISFFKINHEIHTDRVVKTDNDSKKRPMKTEVAPVPDTPHRVAESDDVDREDSPDKGVNKGVRIDLEESNQDMKDNDFEEF